MSLRDVDEVVVAEDAAGAARVFAERLAAAARAGGEIGLSGGTSPRRAFELAAQLEPDWSRVLLWWCDERCVPPDDERSNFRLAREALLDRVERPPRAVHRIRGELDLVHAADLYDAELEGVELELAHLGIGPDGHTASLFPAAPSLDEESRRALAVPRPDGLFGVTMTLPVLAAARTVLFFVTGRDRANAVARAFALPPHPTTPASLVRSSNGATVLILDREAASEIDV